VNDWRIIKENEEVFKGAKLLKIVFPEFWKNAYKKKNNFFQYVFSEAKQHVEKLGINKEYLEKDHCKALWHRHCDFCTKEITIVMQEECYCTDDGYGWICEKCYNDLKENFEWKIDENAQDILADNIALKIIKE